MGKRLRLAVGLLSVILLVGFGSGHAHADTSLDDERARAHYIAGESHFAAGRWADAVREFTLAYELSERQEMLINRSRAYERNGQLDEAKHDLELLLARYPQTRYRSEAEPRLERLVRAILARPAAPLAPVVEARERGDDAPAEPPVVAPVEVAPPPVTSVSRWPSWPVLALGAGAVVVGAIALGTGLKAHALYQDLERGCLADVCPPSLHDDRDRGRAQARASTGLTFGALALVGGAVGLWVRARRHAPSRVDVALDASAKRGAAARLQVRF